MRTYENKDELKNEINKVKIIFFDIDGTLLEMGKTEITPNNEEGVMFIKTKWYKNMYRNRASVCYHTNV